MMKFAKGTDKVLTIIYTVFSVLLIATFILLLIYAGGLMNNAGGSIIKAGSYSPDDYTAGYRFMGHLFYGGLSFPLHWHSSAYRHWHHNGWQYASG